MNKYPLIGGSICAVVLLVLASLTNVVGYQAVQSPNQKAINSEVDQKELLFQTILDIANNKEIQKVILGSEITGKKLFDTDVRFSVFIPPVLTEIFLKRIYTMGVIFTKTIGKSKVHSLLEQYPVSNQGMQKKLRTVIEKDMMLKKEMAELSSLSCGCENGNATTWTFPIICILLFPLYMLITDLADAFPFPNIFCFLSLIIGYVGDSFHCFW
jgi:hypothetical protein